MLRQSGTPARPDIKRIIDKMLKSDANFDRYENRSAHREHLVRAVEIVLRESGETFHTFSRNVSATGIGVVSLEQFDTNAVGVLSIASIDDDEETQILAECRWCKPFGPKWFISGWQFISLKR